ncbi:MAG: glycosyltransferase family 39 protein [Desulfarculaceae bacterium]|nr:glycosyltransferase family 39 protein [Desulfarculaceae bacterium]MCF8074207.1 glycosyltransferase family 39 protein [Desulfarculaceae bacterium]MCF8102788.1 glycosyltransferase family 39 protein [Desulfarculaceae bacterium]MCF8116357.1 glycosyltransferase family 39 protein [Desulfarculaceae bacterium]
MNPWLPYSRLRLPRAALWAALGPGLAAGALLGLKSQLYFMSADGWGGAWLRLPLGLLAGVLAGLILAWVWGLISADRADRPVHGASRMSWSLLGLVPFIWLNWEALGFWPWLWLVPAGLLGLMLAPAAMIWATGWALAALIPAMLLLWGSLGAGPPVWMLSTLALGALYFLALARRLALEPEDERPAPPWVGLALAGALLLGLGLRLAGLDHAWPLYIPHVDAPKQLGLLPAFMAGNLVPSINYPVSHIYLYTALHSLWQWMGAPGLSMHQWATGQNGWLAYVLAARGLQAAMGAVVPLLAFLAARRLWGVGAGLIAAFLLAVDPLQMTYSRQLMGDVPQTLWVWLGFYFAARILGPGRWWDYLFAGLAAGAAVAAKVYGGYVILVILVAWGLARPWAGFAPLVVLAVSMIAGCLLFSPLFWVEPARWWHDMWLVVAKASPGKHMTNPALGLWYALKALIRRSGWAWVVLSAGGVIFLGLRHRRVDVLALSAALLSLAIVGVRLSYLREWDLVNLTPFLSLATAALLASLLSRLKRPLWRRTALVLVAIFLAMQGVTAMSDAWLARLPDTGQMARRWVAKVLAPDQLMAGEYPVSKGHWLTQDNYLRSHKWDLRSELTKSAWPKSDELGLLVLERFWWDSLLPQRCFRPLQQLASRNYYWENPDIGIYLPQVPDYDSQIILPHVRATLPGPAYIFTPWSRTRPMDLLVGGRFAHRLGFRKQQWIISGKALGKLTFAALGQGKARLFSAPEIGTPLDLAWDRAQSGRICPARRIIPARPRAYGVEAVAHHEDAFMWVGLYPQAQGALPTLMRAGDWQGMARIATSLGSEASPEARVMATAALLEAGQTEAAEKTLADLQAKHPTFLTLYRTLATAPDQASFDLAIANLTTANPPLLYWERLRWPYTVPGWPEPHIVKDDEGMRLTLAQPFLPGRLRLHLELNQPLSAPGRLRIASAGWEYQAELTTLELAAGSQRAELYLKVKKGPVFLTLELQAPGAGIKRLLVEPDLRAEFAWRWQVLSARLAGLAAWPK